MRADHAEDKVRQTKLELEEWKCRAKAAEAELQAIGNGMGGVRSDLEQLISYHRDRV